jgi:hypothetical protein
MVYSKRKKTLKFGLLPNSDLAQFNGNSRIPGIQNSRDSVGFTQDFGNPGKYEIPLLIIPMEFIEFLFLGILDCIQRKGALTSCL